MTVGEVKTYFEGWPIQDLYLRGQQTQDMFWR